MPREAWRVIDETGGRYEVSDRGRVRMIAKLGRELRLVRLKDGRIAGRLMPTRDTCVPCPPRLISLVVKRNGYVQVRLSFPDGRPHYCLVHRLVCMAFYGPPPPNRPQADYRNGCKSDNRLANLRWISQSENIQDGWNRKNFSQFSDVPRSSSRRPSA